MGPIRDSTDSTLLESIEKVENFSGGGSRIDDADTYMDTLGNIDSFSDISMSIVVDKIYDRMSHTVFDQEHIRCQVFDLSIAGNDVMGEYTALDNNFEIDKRTFCTSLYETKYCDDLYTSYIKTGNNYVDRLTVMGNKSIHLETEGDEVVNETCKGNLTKTGETKGDVHEKFTTVGKQTVEYVRGGDRNFSVTVEGNCIEEEKCNGTTTIIKETEGNVEEKTTRGADLNRTTTVGNDYEDNITVTGHKKYVSKTTGGVTHDYFNAGEGNWKWVTMGDLVENYTRNKNVTTTLNVRNNVTNNITIGENYVDNFTINGNITENRTIIGDITKTVEQIGVTVERYKNNNRIVKTISSKIDANDSDVAFYFGNVNGIGLQKSEITENGESIYKRVKGDLSIDQVVNTCNETLTIIKGANKDDVLETYKYKKLTLNTGETIFALCLETSTCQK